MSRRLPTARRRRHPGEPDDSFEAFVAGSGDALFRLAVVLSTDVAAGEDLYQETMQRLSAHWGRLDNPHAWARRVMHNLSVDRFRARRARPEEVPASDERSVPADRRAAERMEAVEVRPALFEALADLGDSQRLVVALRFLEDRSEAEVAELLGVPVGTVKSTASRGIARLRRHPSLAHLFPSGEATG